MPKETPDGKRLQMVVCSATLHHPEVKKFAETLMYHPTWVDLKVVWGLRDSSLRLCPAFVPVLDLRDRLFTF